MASGKFVSYIRVSTGKQGRSGLGLEAQQSAIMDFLNGGSWELLKEFKEVESGKDDERPELLKALKLCQLTGATLIIAKLDRLSRDIHFITSLMKAGTDFVACDMPQASQFTIHIYAALAQQERLFISERTKAALQAAKLRGVKLGTNNLTEDGRTKGARNAVQARQEKAQQYASSVSPVVVELRDEGKSLRQIAKELNERSIRTARGGEGKWTAMKVKAVLDNTVK
jgi:DNA invertase Pin-like site-specific DNA recombinase